MLVLTRKTGEAIRVGNDITIKVQAIRGNRVQIAIDAPVETGILRAELLELDFTPSVHLDKPVRKSA